MRVWSIGQVMLCISAACFVASFIVAGFSPEHELVLTFSRASAVSFVLGLTACFLSVMAHRIVRPRSTGMQLDRR